MLERGNGVPSRARVLWANLSAQGARVRERWLTRPLAPCSQLKAHSREREIGSQDCYSNMVKQCLTMFCRETLEYNTFCRETLKYNTFCRKNLDSALWAKKMANLRCEPTPHFMPLWITSYLNYAEGRKKPSQIHQMSHSRDKCIGGVWARLTDDLPTGSCAHHNIIHTDSQSFPQEKRGKGRS